MFEQALLAFRELVGRVNTKLKYLTDGLQTIYAAEGLALGPSEQRVYYCGGAFHIARDPISLVERPLVVIVAFDYNNGSTSLIATLGVPGVGYLAAHSVKLKTTDIDAVFDETTVEMLHGKFKPLLDRYLGLPNPKHWSPRLTS